MTDEQKREHYSQRKPRNPTEHLASIGIFVKLAESRSFSLAAKRLAMSPSGVSKSIKKTEERLGVRLLNRTTRSFGLTQEGEVYLDRCIRLLAHLEEAERSLSDVHMGVKGRVRLQVPLALGREIVAPALKEFFLLYPEIAIDVVLDGRVPDLVENDVDIAIQSAAPPDSRFIARKLSRVHYVLCASPDYIKERGQPRDIEELKLHNCINYISPRTGRYRQWDLSCGNDIRTLHISGGLSCNDIAVARDMAVLGVGIAYLPDFVAIKAIEQGKLRMIMPDTIHEGPPYYMVYIHRELPARCKVLRDFLIKILPVNPPWMLF
jgi:LysR family transcriptional regulator for bpeEF and oprC